MNYFNKSFFVKGLSLIELMIAITISLFLVLGIFQIYLNSQSNYKTQKQISRLQENGRYAMHKLTQSIRMGGNLGGANNRLSIKAATGVTFSPIIGECYTGARRWSAPMIDTSSIDAPPLVYGTNDSRTAFNGCVSDANYNGSDIISIHYAAAQSFQGERTTNTSPDTKVITESSNDFIAPGTLFIRTDIKNSKVFEIATDACDDDPLKCDIPTDAQSASNIAVNSPVKAELFYIRKCSDTTADCVAINADNVPTLVRVSLEPRDAGGPDGPTIKQTALIEGVVAMQVQYGIDSVVDDDNTIDRYENASDGDLGDFLTRSRNWSKVKTVRVWLLMRSAEKELGYIDPNAPYDMGDKTGVTAVTVENGYRHMLFTTTINLRNPGQQSL